MMDQRLQFIFDRRSIRKYTSEPVSEEQIEQLLRAAMAAPSANNSRPWRFVAVTDRDDLKRLAECGPYFKMLREAALCVAVCAEPGASPQYWEQDCSAATENLLLAAAALGLGAVWLGVHPKDDRKTCIRAVLGIPAEIEVQCLISIGHPAETPPQRDQYNEDWAHWGKWDAK